MTQQFLKKEFAIVMDGEDQKTNKNFFTRLIDGLTRKLKREKHPVTTRLRELLEQDEFEYESIIQVGKANNNKYFLMRDFDKLFDLLKDVCEDCPKRKEREYEVEITIERPKRKKLKKVTVYDKVTILERWVKIGYKMYRRQFDCYSGDEYIVVDGDTYEIRRDRYGKEHLV
jgi:hypothetical protein